VLLADHKISGGARRGCAHRYVACSGRFVSRFSEGGVGAVNSSQRPSANARNGVYILRGLKSGSKSRKAAETDRARPQRRPSESRRKALCGKILCSHDSPRLLGIHSQSGLNDSGVLWPGIPLCVKATAARLPLERTAWQCAAFAMYMCRNALAGQSDGRETARNGSGEVKVHTSWNVCAAADDLRQESPSLRTSEEMSRH